MYCLFAVPTALLIGYVSLIVIRKVLTRRRKPKTIGFFHPYCSSHGGGERVLWHAVRSILDHYPNYTIFIYSDGFIDKNTILQDVATRFQIDLLKKSKQSVDRHTIGKIDYSYRINFIRLSYCRFLDAGRYPYVTLLFQNLMAFIVGIEAAYRMVPEVFIESIGFATTMPVFRFHNCKIVTYVHYPTISEDMIANVKTSMHPSFNNRRMFIRYRPLRLLKLFYYKFLALCYGHVGRTADIVLVNSNWTREHIEKIWNVKAITIYPPCDVSVMQSLSLSRFKNDQNDRDITDIASLNIISIAQFRPEKNHLLQLELFKKFLDKSRSVNSKLILCGGARNEDDKLRVKELEYQIKIKGLENNVEIKVNVSFKELIRTIEKADVAIHTMNNEHFGIVLIECMAAGLIMVAHDSGGPKKDIIKNGENGFLATEASDFCEKIHRILLMSKSERLNMRNRARETANDYSDEIFSEKLSKAFNPLLSRN